MIIEAVQENPKTHYIKINSFNNNIDFYVGDEAMSIDCFVDDILYYKFFAINNIVNIPPEVESEITRVIFKKLDGTIDGIYNLFVI